MTGGLAERQVARSSLGRRYASRIRSTVLIVTGLSNDPRARRFLMRAMLVAAAVCAVASAFKLLEASWGSAEQVISLVFTVGWVALIGYAAVLLRRIGRP